MSNLEDEVKVLKEKNNELVQKVQYWKMTAAQRENEKLELMKEINELRLKLGVSHFIVSFVRLLQPIPIFVVYFYTF